MAFDFSALPTAPYLGKLIQPAAVSLCGAPKNPMTTPVLIDWQAYFGGTGPFNIATGNNGRAGVIVDLNNNTAGVQPIEAIRSLYVDNTNNPTSVFIRFPDTDFVITVAAETSKCVPVFTNSLVFHVYTTAMVAALPVSIGAWPATKIFANNFTPQAFDYSEAPPSLGLFLRSSGGTGVPEGPYSSLQNNWFGPSAIADTVLSLYGPVTAAGLTYWSHDIFNIPGRSNFSTNYLRIQSLRTRCSNIAINADFTFEFWNTVGFSYFGAHVKNGAVVDYTAREYHNFTGMEWVLPIGGSPYSVVTNNSTPLITHNGNIQTAATGAPGVATTFYDRDLAVTNNAVIYSIGIYSASVQAMTAKIALQNSPTSFTTVVNQAFAHPGGGWFDVVLATPYTVPSAGIYRIGFFIQPIAIAFAGAPDTNRSIQAGDIVGFSAGFTADALGDLSTRWIENGIAADFGIDISYSLNNF